jgi:hypothetical protein
MPTYVVIDTKTKEISELWLSISQYEEHMKANPRLQRYFETAPGFTMNGKSFVETPSKLGGFKEVLQRIGENNINSPLHERYRATPRDTKTVRTDIAVGKALKKRNEAIEKRKKKR